MSEIHKKYFDYFGPDTRIRLAKYFSTEIEEFLRLTASLLEMLDSFQSKNPEFNQEKPFHSAAGLMRKGTNTLGCALDVALHGYLWESPALLRIAIENFCVGWDIVNSSKRHAEWIKDKKFESTTSISNAKAIVPIIGRLIGLLSNVNIHVSPLNSSPAMIKGDDLKFQVFGYIEPGKESIRKSQIYMVLFVTYICLQLSESCFFKYASNPETLEMNADGKTAITKVTPEHRVFVAEMQKVFQDLIEGKEDWV